MASTITRESHRAAIKAALIYFIVGAIWIAFSDQAVEFICPEGQMLTILQTIKGGFYVTITALLVYWLVRRYLRQIQMMEERLRRQQKLEALGTLAAGVAHEINNPISVILNSAELIADKTDDQPELNRYANYIVSETEHVTDIVRELLHLARLDVAEAPKFVAPKQLLEAATGLIDVVFRTDRIHVQKVIADDVPEISCRPRQLQQVLLNLLTNARDALNERYPSPTPEKQLSIAVAKATCNGAPAIEIRVQDRGNGIPPDVMAQMFNAFYTTKPEGHGTGLGLAISQSIVNEHGGALTCQSTVGQGTTFSILLPVSQPPRSANSAP